MGDSARAKTTVKGAAIPSAMRVTSSARTVASAGSSRVLMPAARTMSQPLAGNERSRPTPKSNAGDAVTTSCSSTAAKSRWNHRAAMTPAATPAIIAPSVTKAPKTIQPRRTGWSCALSASRTADKVGGDRRRRRLGREGMRDGRSSRARRSRPSNEATNPMAASSGVTASNAPPPRPYTKCA